MTKKIKNKQYPVITVIWEDKKWIVAQISSFLWEEKINIEEIQQWIMQGNFFMVMSVGIKDSKYTIPKLSDELEKLWEKIWVKILIHDQKIFTSMYKI